MSSPGTDDDLARFIANIGAAWYAIVLDHTVGWASEIGDFFPGRGAGEGYIVRGDELGSEFTDWIEKTLADANAREDLAIVLSDISPDIVGRIRIIGARASAQSAARDRVSIAYEDVIFEEA